jgi:hypothetical protein
VVKKLRHATEGRKEGREREEAIYEEGRRKEGMVKE